MQKLVEDAMPDLDVGLVMNEWTDCKALLSGTSNLDCYSFAEIVKFISKAGKKGLLQAFNLLMLLARILVMSPYSMYVEFAISAYNLIKDDHRASLDREKMNAYTWLFTWTCLQFRILTLVP